ncbi:MAG TPA: MarR family transcriptional regulator [Solirubrobacterales bacterium]|nr:MarR family transcriptional regulator [Solirubrobacterales bacterium]
MTSEHASLGLLMREPVRLGNSRIADSFATRGHPEVRPPHGDVFQFLDQEGTRVSTLAERAQITKQSMAELVAHLEKHGYVERVPDPDDGRAKLVRTTRRGEEIYAIAREVIAEIEMEWTEILGKKKLAELRRILERLNAGIAGD